MRGADLSTGAKAMLVKGKTGCPRGARGRPQRGLEALAPLVGKGARFANDEELTEMTGLTKGAVPPFGRCSACATIYDESLLEVEAVNFNAGSQHRLDRHAPGAT